MALADSDLRLLMETPLFGGLGSEAIVPIIGALSSASYAKGQTIFHADEPANHFFMVISGWVWLHQTTHHGEEAIIGLFTRGETFGEAAMFLSRGFPATATAGVNSRLLRIDAQIMMNEIRAQPELAFRMLASMSRKLKTFVDHITLSRMTSTHERVSRFLASLCTAKAGSETIDFPFQKKLIAARLDMSPETLSRALKKLRSIGVYVENRKIVVSDVKALKQVFTETMR